MTEEGASRAHRPAGQTHQLNSSGPSPAAAMEAERDSDVSCWFCPCWRAARMCRMKKHFILWRTFTPVDMNLSDQRRTSKLNPLYSTRRFWSGFILQLINVDSLHSCTTTKQLASGPSEIMSNLPEDEVLECVSMDQAISSGHTESFPSAVLVSCWTPDVWESRRTLKKHADHKL